MRKYLQMLITQAHSPAAAEDLALMLSGVNPGSLRKSRSTTEQQFSGVLSLSNEMSDLRNWSTERRGEAR